MYVVVLCLYSLLKIKRVCSVSTVVAVAVLPWSWMLGGGGGGVAQFH